MGLIGGFLVTAQCGSAQEEDIAVALGLPQRTSKQLQEHFDDVLLDSRHDNWNAGWEEARALGSVATQRSRIAWMAGSRSSCQILS